MRRDQAVALLFWHHARARWNDANWQGSPSVRYVWPPFPREDELRSTRIALYEVSRPAVIPDQVTNRRNTAINRRA